MKVFGRILQVISALLFLAACWLLYSEGIVEVTVKAVARQQWMDLLAILFVSLLVMAVPLVFLLLGCGMVRSWKNRQQRKQMQQKIDALMRQRAAAAAAYAPRYAAPADIPYTAPETSPRPAAPAHPAPAPDPWAQELTREEERQRWEQRARAEERARARTEAMAAGKEKLAHAAKNASDKAKVLGDAVKSSGTITGTSHYGTVAGILYLMIAVYPLFTLSSALRYATASGKVINVLTTVVFLAVYAVLTVQLLRKKTNGVLVAALGALAALTVLSFVIGFFNKSYYAYYYYPYYLHKDSEYKFNLLCALPTLSRVMGYGSLFALAVIHGTDYVPGRREKTRKLWFLPAAFLLGEFVVIILFWLCYDIGLIDWRWVSPGLLSTLFSCLLRAAPALFAALWLTYPDGLPKSEKEAAAQVYGGNDLPASAYFDLFKHTLLLMLTCGIWQLMWIFRTTENLNYVRGEATRSPVKKLLLCLFVPFYQAYWTYKSAQRVDKLAKSRGIEGSIYLWCLIAGFFMPVIGFILIQDRMNTILSIKQDPAET